jgi:hypothetical protein
VAGKPAKGGTGQVCDVCGREAIGFQIMGCCTAVVCEEHAEPMLRGLKPGEIREWGICCFQRFGKESPGS